MGHPPSERGEALQGTVVDAHGRPVADARVAVASGSEPFPEIAAQTDAAGVFALPALRPGEYVVEAYAGAHRARAAVSVGAAPPTVRLVFDDPTVDPPRNPMPTPQEDPQPTNSEVYLTEGSPGAEVPPEARAAASDFTEGSDGAEPVPPTDAPGGLLITHGADGQEPVHAEPPLEAPLEAPPAVTAAGVVPFRGTFSIVDNKVTFAVDGLRAEIVLGGR